MYKIVSEEFVSGELTTVALFYLGWHSFATSLVSSSGLLLWSPFLSDESSVTIFRQFSRKARQFMNNDGFYVLEES